MTKTKTEMVRVRDIATAYTHLTIAKNCTEYAVFRLRHTDVEIEEELWEAYESLDKLLRKLLGKLRKEMYKEDE